MNERQAITCDMTIMLPSSARRMSLGRYHGLNENENESESENIIRDYIYLLVFKS